MEINCVFLCDCSQLADRNRPNAEMIATWRAWRRVLLRAKVTPLVNTDANRTWAPFRSDSDGTRRHIRKAIKTRNDSISLIAATALT